MSAGHDNESPAFRYAERRRRITAELVDEICKQITITQGMLKKMHLVGVSLENLVPGYKEPFTIQEFRKPITTQGVTNVFHV